MAKRRDEMLRAAELKAQKAEDLRCYAITDFRVNKAPAMKEIKNPKTGLVCKMVSVLHCEMDVAGLGTISRDIEMEAGPLAGVTYELNSVLSPALKEFLVESEKAISEKFKLKTESVNPDAPPPLLSDPNRPKDEGRSARMKALNAEMTAKRRAAKEAEEAAAAALEGGES